MNRVVFVGADGALGKTLVLALGARPLDLRCPDLAAEAGVDGVHDADVVIHAAGPRVRPSLRWSDYLREHVGTTTQVALSMRPSSHLILISSAAIYGSGRGLVTASTAPQPDAFPVPAYAWAKLAAEHTARAICAERGVALTVLRPSIIYGIGSGGVVITLRNLARRGIRVVLEPESTKQHLLHLDLFTRLLQARIAAPPPERCATYVVADPFVVTNRDLNAAFRKEGPRAAPLPMSLRLLGAGLARWQRGADQQPPRLAAVAAMLTLDNVYDAETCLRDFGIGTEDFGRDRFDEFMRRA